jgi:hypothetical protein
MTNGLNTTALAVQSAVVTPKKHDADSYSLDEITDYMAEAERVPRDTRHSKEASTTSGSRCSISARQ